MLGARWSALATRRDFRLLVAVAFVGLHLLLFARLASLRLGVPFDASPGAEPAFARLSEPLSRASPAHWDRLAVSRFDAQHYIALALRGYSQCPAQDLRHANLPEIVKYCGFSFYPGYPLLGRIVALGNRIPIDYALFGTSILASIVFLYLWTSSTITSALGVGTTYLALLLFNVFPTGFTLVTVQTEPTVLALTMGAFLGIARRNYLLAGVLAGAASGMRVSGAATSAAVGVALVVSLFVDPPKGWLAWRRRSAAAVLSAWGLLAIVGYFGLVYSDPLLYFHAHSQAYGYLEVAASGLSPEFVYRTLETAMRPGIWVAFCLLWLALGLRSAVSGFPPLGRAFAASFTIVGASIALWGSSRIAFMGMNRYWLLTFPLFWAIAVVVKQRPVAGVLWVALCAWAYWNVDLCVYACQTEATRACRLSPSR